MLPIGDPYLRLPSPARAGAFHGEFAWHPQPNANRRLCPADTRRRCCIPFIDAVMIANDRDNWFERAKGMENEPERGIRCTMCFACVASARRCMPMNMVSRSSPARWVSRAGRTCKRSTIAACARPRTIRACLIGNGAGATAAVNAQTALCAAMLRYCPLKYSNGCVAAASCRFNAFTSPITIR